MRIVTFYSYKGGVGRTLALANLARALALLGQKVFAVDFDLEAPGLHYKLRPPDGRLSKGVVDLIHDFAAGTESPDSLSDFVTRVRASSEADAEIVLMPAGKLPQVSYWQHLAQIDWHDLFYSEGAPGLPLFLELTERIRKEYEPDFLLIDARTGITELGGLATSVLADDLVCLMAHNRESLEGSRTVLRSVLCAQRPAEGPPIRLLPVVSRIPPGLEPGREREIVGSVRDFLNQEAGNLAETLSVERVYVLHSEPGLEVSESLLIGGDGISSRLLEDYLILFAQLLSPDAAEKLLKLLTERMPGVRRILFLHEPKPTAGLAEGRKWGKLSEEICRLLEGDSVAATAVADQREEWQRVFESGGAGALAKAIWERSDVTDVLSSMNEAHRSLTDPKSAETLEQLLSRIVPLLYDRRLVYSLPHDLGGVVLQVPVATRTMAEIVLASVTGQAFRFLPLTEPEAEAQPAAQIRLPETGIDFAGDRAFKDFVDHLARTFLPEEDRRAVGTKPEIERYEILARLITDELEWRARHDVDGFRRYFLFDSRFVREHRAFLANLQESLPALLLVELTGDDLPGERRLCRPLRDLLYQSQRRTDP